MTTLPAKLKSSVRLPATTNVISLPVNRPNLKPLFDASVHLPTGGYDRDRAIKCLAKFLSSPRMREKWRAKFGRNWSETTSIRKLREGRLDLTREAIEEAEAGDATFDAALQYVSVEVDRWMREHGGAAEREGYLFIQAYGERVRLHPRKRRGGRPAHDNWVRDGEVCTLIWYVCRALGVSPTRNETGGADSGISIIAAAFVMANIRLFPKAKNTSEVEASIQANIWGGLRGRLIREDLEKEFGPLN
jgi:hypothetical protein